MQRYEVTRIKPKSKCNAAGAKMKQGHNFMKPRTRKNYQVKDRIFEDKCTQGYSEAGAESEASFATFWLDRSWSIFSKI